MRRLAIIFLLLCNSAWGQVSATQILLILALTFGCVAGLQSIANAQCTSPCLSLPNESVTGTLQFHLAKVTGSPSSALLTTAGDTAGAIGISTNGGKSGNAYVLTFGPAVCTFDGPTTAGDYVSISATVAGDCTSAGASCPVNETVGRIFQTHAGAGDYPVLLSIGACANGGSGGSSPGGANTDVQFNDSNSFGGNAAFTFDKGTSLVSLTGNMSLPLTTDGTHGGITLGGNSFLHAFGTRNVFLGDTAGNFTQTGQVNTGGGFLTLNGLTSGSGNTAWGAQAIRSVSSGSSNVGFGLNAGLTISGGSSNSFFGTGADATNGFLNNAAAIGSSAIVGADSSMVLGTSDIKVGTGTSTPGSKLDVWAFSSQTFFLFTGAGLDDLTTGGTYLNSAACSYTVTVNTPGAPDTFDWDDGACGNSAMGVSMAASVALSYGTLALFAATTGHTAGNFWQFTMTPVNPLNIADAAGTSILQALNNGTIRAIGLPIYANNAAALAGGLPAGGLYRTNADPDPVCVVH